MGIRAFIYINFKFCQVLKNMIMEILSVDLISTIRFNFHYFKFQKAIRLPVFMYNAAIQELEGGVKLEGHIGTGMIKLGKRRIKLFGSKKPFVYSNKGGILEISKCVIGHDSSIIISKNGCLKIYQDLNATYALEVRCNNRIIIGKECTFGWNVLIDDDVIYSIHNDASISIGKCVWIANNSSIYSGCKVPDYSIVASNSNVFDKYNGSHKLIAASPAKVQKEGVTMDLYQNYENEDKYTIKKDS